jgi:hypothetical protein
MMGSGLVPVDAAEDDNLVIVDDVGANLTSVFFFLFKNLTAFSKLQELYSILVQPLIQADVDCQLIVSPVLNVSPGMSDTKHVLGGHGYLYIRHSVRYLN